MTSVAKAKRLYISKAKRLYITTERAWNVYRAAMEPTKAQAAQRHMLTEDEFYALCWNERITKATAYHDGQMVGLAFYTRHLDAYNWIEPAYFEQRWPDAYKREAVFYVLFVVVTPGAPTDTFPKLVQTVVADIKERRGVGALDWSQTRIHRGLARASRLIIGRAAPLTHETIDTQWFHTYEFNWPEE